MNWFRPKTKEKIEEKGKNKKLNKNKKRVCREKPQYSRLKEQLKTEIIEKRRKRIAIGIK